MAEEAEELARLAEDSKGELMNKSGEEISKEIEESFGETVGNINLDDINMGGMTDDRFVSVSTDGIQSSIKSNVTDKFGTDNFTGKLKSKFFEDKFATVENVQGWIKEATDNLGNDFTGDELTSEINKQVGNKVTEFNTDLGEAVGNAYSDVLGDEIDTLEDVPTPDQIKNSKDSMKKVSDDYFTDDAKRKELYDKVSDKNFPKDVDDGFKNEEGDLEKNKDQPWYKKYGSKVLDYLKKNVLKKGLTGLLLFGIIDQLAGGHILDFLAKAVGSAAQKFIDVIGGFISNLIQPIGKAIGSFLGKIIVPIIVIIVIFLILFILYKLVIKKMIDKKKQE